MSVLDSIIEHEGFKAVPYPDPIHGWEVPTFGHGLTYITEDESRYIVERRVHQLREQLSKNLSWFTFAPQIVQDVLVEMAYQMGVQGLLRFRKTLDALESGSYKIAAAEMLDSRWARQTPRRANELANRIRALA